MRRGARSYPIPQRTKNALLDAEQRMTVRRMLTAGASVTYFGQETILTLESGGRGTFPTAMVDDIRRELERRP